MHDHRALLEARLERFLLERLRPAVHVRSSPLEIAAWHAPGEPVPAAEALAQEYAPVGLGTAWGRPWSTSWLHLTGAVPDAWYDADGALPAGTRPELVVDLGFDTSQPGFQSEGIVWTPSGSIVKGLSPYNAHVPWDEQQAHVDGRGVDVYVEAAANPDLGSDFLLFAPTPLGDPATSGDVPLYRLTRADVALLDVTAWELVQDVEALRGLLHELPVDSPRRAQLLVAIDAMIDAVDPHDVPGTAAAGREVLAPALASPAHASAHRVVAVGHAHIDSAWLWPTRETVRKCARTFSNVLALMDEHPDFVFACSSAQQFAWIKEHHPELFARIKEKVASGQFVPVGGMWVESDTNMPGSEALVRQFVAGQGFFTREFGAPSQEAWLPDSFGYTGALPQIIAGAGARWFLTQKISWNKTNKMPHHTFWWEGIDGTKVFTHFPPVDKYNSDLSGADLAHAQRNFSDKARATTSVVPFGWGDGGGGPTREMIAAAHRNADLEGAPAVRLGSPREFFADAEAEYPGAPVWSGEMYLEFHRGTYTSQARTKQGNRRSEHLLREAELWATTAAVRTGAEYPYAALETAWHTVLLQQFHDILPGSSIAWVHQEAERRYAEVAAVVEDLVAASARALLGEGEVPTLLNAAPDARGGVRGLGAAPVAGPAVDGAGAGAVEGAVGGAPRTTAPVRDGEDVVLDNGLVRVRVDARGVFTEVHDLVEDRAVLAPGAVGKLLQLHRDTPNEWDAWDIDEFYRRTVTDLLDLDSLEVTGDGVRITRSFGASTVVETVSLRAGEPVVDVAFDIDWHERQKLLKLAYPVDVHADRSASETQFGHVMRPTHTNTSWDAAKFEICAHRWVHVAEAGYGVAVANDATYGHDVQALTGEGQRGTAIRLSLLRAPLFPDPEADQGRHVLRTALVVGAGVRDAVRVGYDLNLPERVVTGAGGGVEPLFALDGAGSAGRGTSGTGSSGTGSAGEAVVVETVKLAEDGSGDVVVRLYESLGGRARTTLVTSFAHGEVVETDLLERPVEGGAVRPVGAPATGAPEAGTSATDVGARIDLELKPFQIVTLRLSPTTRR